MTITYYVPLKNSCHVWGFLPSWSWEGSCWLGPLRLSILSQSTREADPPLDEQLFWERRTRKEKGTHYKESAERSHLLPPPPSTTCQQKALSVWHTRALLPTIPGHFKGVLLRSKSSGLPTALSHRRTLDANISRIFVHLSNSWKSPPTNPALFFHPICQRGRRTESRASSWYTDLHVLDANPPGLCATWKDSPRKTDYIPATSKWSGFARHSLFSCLEAFLKAWLCNKGASPPLYSQTHCLPIRLRYMFLGPARKPEWLPVSPDEILKKSL